MNSGKDLVLETLQHACSQQPDDLKRAELQLQQWETESGFYLTLVEIFSEHSIQMNVRWQAVLYFKNGVDRYWRKTAPNAIAEDEKVRIRCGLIYNLKEPVSQVATQLAVLMGKIARLDCPRDWPELLPALFEAVRSVEPLMQHRALLTIHHVVKQLASKRLAADRRTFQDLTSQMFTFLLELWGSQTNLFLNAAASGASWQQVVMPALERCHLALKVLRKLLIYGFKKVHERDEAMTFVKAMFEHTRPVLEFRQKCVAGGVELGSLRILAEKVAVLMTKVLWDLLENCPFSFVPFVRLSLDLVLVLVFTPTGDGLVFERFTVQCLNLMKAMIMCPEYKPCKVLEETKEPQTLEAHQIKHDFFSAEVIAGICHKLVHHFFLLTQDDLDTWHADPEGFVGEVDGGESWKYSLRPATESLYVSLFHEYRTLVTPVLLEMVAASYNPVDPADLHGLLQKDAVYHAVGLAAFELFDDVDFDGWFAAALIGELRADGANYAVIRRRVIWLVGQWTGVKFSSEHRPMLYEAVVHLLRPEEDLVVRLTAAQALKHSVDDFEFDPEGFMPYLPTIFGLLFDLLQEARECETKMQVLYVMSFMVEVVGVGIQPHAAPLIQYLPRLWAESADHNLLRCTILTTLIHVVNGLLRDSKELHSFMVAIIGFSIDVSHDAHVYLLEDGLLLWLATLENTAHCHPALLQLFDFMLPLLETTSEHLRVCLQITMAYTILCPREFMERYGPALVVTLTSMLREMRSEGLVLVLRAAETLLRVQPAEAAVLLLPMLPAVISAVLVEGNQQPMVMSMYLSIVARLVLYTEDIFTRVLDQVAGDKGCSSDLILEQLVSSWTDKLCLVSPEERRKLCALALTRLCGSGWPPVLRVWPAAVTAVVEVVFDITADDDSLDDKLVISGGRPSSPESYEFETEHVLRRLAMAKQDPVHTVPLRHFLGQEMRRLQGTMDPSTLMSLAADLEEDAKKVLQEVTAA